MKPKVLFMCVANSARSQMAEGLARQRFGDRFEFYSAGSEPKFVHPMAIKALAEIGIDIASAKSSSVDELNLGEVETVITLCAEEVCPLYLNAKSKLHWPHSDPAGVSEEKQLDSFRQVRDQIQARLEEHLASE